MANSVTSTSPNDSPIGVFDSGIGGLTVVAALRRVLPHESIVYLGDTARVPYGTKSPDVVTRYAFACANFLVSKGAKLVVVACNTATAHAIEALSAGMSVPVIGVISPGAQAAVAATRNGVVSVIGTEGTMQSGAYHRALTALKPDIRVVAQACPMFVPLAEEGLADHRATRLLAEDYLTPMLKGGADTLVLGCTHYPLLAHVIRAVVGPSVRIIDSAQVVAEAVRERLEKLSIASHQDDRRDRFFATDAGQRFARVGQAFLGEALSSVEWVDLAV